ncbi:phosphatase PAP2 family protein [Hymenobacter sp. BT188]|uniref:phosphatase PAP2 family protein n=1 Tax=Hymenobacter sp. BT188 TaxID=2763504 RepID=UPI0016512DBE|nr:phosphatase PAP2 family protein [Hymenobacter sp. BT188]MBC6606468.1 phosphatase PAP2 family protein [Hymenobacter sp. BT188]
MPSFLKSIVGIGLLLSAITAHAQGVIAVLPVADSVLASQTSSPPRLRPTATTWRVAVPVALIGLGYIGRNENFVDEAKEAIQYETREAFPQFHSHLDAYTRHAPIVAAFALQAAGLRGERGVVPFTLIYGLSHVVNSTLTSGLKYLVQERRPDVAADFSSFPSAHTSEAFMAATLLHEQFGHAHPWLSVAGYSVAVATGTMRVLNDRHWASDVVAGAAVGFLSAETVWRLYPVLVRRLPRHFGQKMLLIPTYASGGTVGAALAVHL